MPTLNHQGHGLHAIYCGFPSDKEQLLNNQTTLAGMTSSSRIDLLQAESFAVQVFAMPELSYPLSARFGRAADVGLARYSERPGSVDSMIN